MRSRVDLTFILFLVALPDIGHTHRSRDARRVMATIRPAPAGLAVDVLVWHRLAGVKARRLIAKHDLDGSKNFNAFEATLAGDQLAPGAIGGLYLTYDQRAWRPDSATAKAVLVNDQTLEVMVLIKYVRQGEKQAEVGFGVRRDTGRHRHGTSLGQISSLFPWVLKTASGWQTRIKARTLKPGAHFAVVVHRVSLEWFNDLGFLSSET